MGVLDIQRRSERLGNLGAVRMANTDDGSVRAADIAANAIRRFNHSRISSLEAQGKIYERIGDSISSVGNNIVNVGGIVKDLEEEERRRNADEYANKFTAKMLAHNQGNGQDVLGAMNETIPESDRGQWMEANGSAAKKIHESVLKDMGLTEDDFKESRMQKWRDSFLFKQNAQWLGKRNSAMTAYADKEAEKRYENDRNDVTDDMVSEDGWKNISASMERLIERKGWGPEQAKAFRRKEGETICGIGIKKAIDATTAEAVLSGVDGGSCFDGLIKSWEGSMDESSFLPPASWISEDDGRGHVTKRNPLKEWLADADMKSLKEAAIKDAKAAKAGWEAGMRKHTKESFVNAQNDILAIPAPEDGDELGQKNYQREVADAYRRLIAKDPRVLSGRGDEWVRDDLKKFAPNKVKVALAAIKGSEYKAARARQRNNGSLFEKTIDLGVPDDSSPSGRRSLSANEKIALSEFLYANGEIDHAAYAKGVRSAKDKTDPLADKFLALVAQGMDAKFPTVCKWQKDMMAYAFSDTKEARELSGKGTGVRTKVAWDDMVQGKVVTKYDRTEEWLYRQTADAATLVVQSVIMEGHRKGESDAELLNRAYAEYQKLTQGVNEGIYRLDIERRMAENRANLDRMKAVRTGSAARWLPQGIELSRRNKAKFGDGQKKDVEGE